MAAPNGASIFPLALITTPQPPEFLVDNLNQLLELIASQAVAQSGGTITNPSLTVQDSSFTIVDDGDATKTLVTSLSGSTTSTKLTLATITTVNRTITFPDATDTLVGKATTDTLTNKTLTAPTITGATITTSTVSGLTVTTTTGTLTIPNGVTLTGPATSGTAALSAPVPVAVGSSLAITAAMSGAPILLNTAGGSTATLPAATGSGNKYKFIVTTTATSNAHKILPASVSDFLNGNAVGHTAAGATLTFSAAAATAHSIQMPFAGTQPSGGFIGDVFEFTDVAANLWAVNGMYQAGTTATTPFSAATT